MCLYKSSAVLIVIKRCTFSQKTKELFEQRGPCWSLSVSFVVVVGAVVVVVVAIDPILFHVSPISQLSLVISTEQTSLSLLSPVQLLVEEQLGPEHWNWAMACSWRICFSASLSVS
eukprot:m.196809 g.196809  ORF g.196809 m.196809 type:complete len:116 (+) comp25858_c1_seq7:977-1324(+)